MSTQRRRLKSLPSAMRKTLLSLRGSIVAAPSQVQLLRVCWALVLVFHERLAFSGSALSARCPWPIEDPQIVDTVSTSVRVKEVRILILSDPQLIDGHTYPNLPSLVSSIFRRLSHSYVQRAYAGLTGRSYGQGPDAVVWLGDLTDGGRREQTEEEWNTLHDRFDSLFPWPETHASSTATASGPYQIVPSPSVVPHFVLAGNHDIGLPLAPGQRPNNYADQRAKSRFLSRYGTPITSSSAEARYQALSGASPTRSRAVTGKLSLNARIQVAAAGPLEPTTHELLLVNAQDLLGMQRIGGQWASPPAPFADSFGGTLRADAKRRFPETFDFVQSIAEASRQQNVTRILFTHVPLDRPAAPQGSCNILERSSSHGVWRSATSSKALQQGTDRDSTYQNLVGPQVSSWLLNSTRPSLVFSGDDHDHCEYAHAPLLSPAGVSSFRPSPLVAIPPLHIPELTLKAFSLTSGASPAGYARLRLTHSSQFGNRISYAPCLLPDQLSVWTQTYPFAAGISLLLIFFVRGTSGVKVPRGPGGRRTDSDDESFDEGSDDEEDASGRRGDGSSYPMLPTSYGRGRQAAHETLPQRHRREGLSCVSTTVRNVLSDLGGVLLVVVPLWLIISSILVSP